ncbi:hypothetical protein N7488_006368 [Penicillium malachiteum]|nr:hypothetical protein N7488_006368 [Penicillium malachiteum]
MMSSSDPMWCQHLFDRSEVASHNKEEDLWVIVDGRVFNLTTFLDTHPGGRTGLLTILGVVLLQIAGSDATQQYHKYHNPQTLSRHEDSLCIGRVEKADSQGKRGWRKVMSALFHSNYD